MPGLRSPVQRIVYAANEANYCAHCQTGGRLLADRALSRLLREDWPRTLEELERRRQGADARIMSPLRAMQAAVQRTARAVPAGVVVGLRRAVIRGAPVGRRRRRGCAVCRGRSRAIPRASSASTSRSRNSSPTGSAGRRGSSGQVHHARCGGRARRFRDRPERHRGQRRARARLAVTIPYYEFREILTVSRRGRDRFRTLADLRGRRVATLGGTLAYDLLLRAEGDHGLVAVTYDDDVHPYSDLAIGRVDAVLLDNVLAERGSARRMPGLTTSREVGGVGHYVGVLAPDNGALRDRVNEILREAMREDGSSDLPHLEVWNDDQPALYASCWQRAGAAGRRATPTASRRRHGGGRAPLPARRLLKAAVITRALLPSRWRWPSSLARDRDRPRLRPRPVQSR